MKIHVFIGMFGGLVDKVQAFINEQDAIEAFEKYTNISWKKYIESDCDTEIFESDKYEGTTIYESWLPENKYNRKFCSWGTDDVISMYPELTQEQAYEIMCYVESHMNCEYGVSWTDIDESVKELFPNAKRDDSYVADFD